MELRSMKLPVHDSAVVAITGRAKLEAFGNPDSNTVGEWFGDALPLAKVICRN
jgi:hypothetical protein